MAKQFKVEGLKELEVALRELPKATGKNVLRRTLKSAAQPFDASWRAKAGDNPKTEGRDLKASGGVSNKLNPRQKSLHKKMFRDDKAAVEMFAGPGPRTSAITEEFGTDERFHDDGASVGSVDPHPFVRPAWDETKMQVLDAVKDSLASEIEKAALRLARKAERRLPKK